MWIKYVFEWMFKLFPIMQSKPKTQNVTWEKHHSSILPQHMYFNFNSVQTLNSFWSLCFMFSYIWIESFGGNFHLISLIGETLGLVSFSRLKAPRLSVSSRSRSNFDYWLVSVSDSSVCLSFQKVMGLIS